MHGNFARSAQPLTATGELAGTASLTDERLPLEMASFQSIFFRAHLLHFLCNRQDVPRHVGCPWIPEMHHFTAA